MKPLLLLLCRFPFVVAARPRPEQKDTQISAWRSEEDGQIR
jgi:hypothetical protein